MLSKDYFQKRAEQNILNSEINAKEIANRVQTVYKLSEKEINDKIEKFYGRYNISSGQNSLEEVKKILNTAELKVFRKESKYFYELAKKENWDKAYINNLNALQSRTYVTRLEDLKLNLYNEIQKTYEYELSQINDGIKIQYEESYYRTMFDYQSAINTGLAFKKPNILAIDKLIKTKWLGTNFSDRVWNDKSKLIKAIEISLPQGFALGENPKQVSVRMRNLIEPKFVERITTDSRGEKRHLTSMCERIARTEMNLIANQASLDSVEELDSQLGGGLFEEYQYLATLDASTSTICADLDGMIFKLADAQEGENFPPMHPNCYDKETEVYTNKGWKLFDELTQKEKVWALNKDTLIPEWVNISNIIKYKYEGDMFEYKNKSFNLCVTPNHNLFLKYTKKDGKGKYRLIEAQKSPKYSNKHYRGCNWIGQNIKNVKLGDYLIDSELYCKFMGYYLSEGSYKTISKSSKGYGMSIAQQTYLEKIYEDLIKLPFNVIKIKDKIIFNDKSVYLDLKKYGRSNQKYVPKIIKKMTPDLIKIFLYAYCLGDGNIRKGKKWKESNFEDSITYSTSSIKIRDDLGELIMKSGGRPYFKLQSTKGTLCFDGKYKTNNDVWIISWNKRIHCYVEKLTRNILDYNDYVYCVEAEKHNVILVKRKGQIVWCGNCRSTYTIVIDDEKISTRVARDESGKTYKVPSNISYKEWKESYMKTID